MTPTNALDRPPTFGFSIIRQARKCKLANSLSEFKELPEAAKKSLPLYAHQRAKPKAHSKS
jgi:hypothetical protein